MRKHSLTLAGHRTSVALEDEFWAEFLALARSKGLSQNELARQLDESRAPGSNLASTIRLAVLAYVRAKGSA